MTHNLSRVLIFVSFLSVTACAGYESQKTLPDDPMSEGQATEIEGDNSNVTTGLPSEDSLPTNTADKENILSKYNYLDPNHLVPTDLLAKAVTYYDVNLAKITNKNYLSVIDFGKKSSLKRFFIIDMKTGAVWAIHTAHGKGSDTNGDGYADKFSNSSGSNMSSLGFYRAAETYSGTHGLSMRLDGLSSTNSKARARAIVVHAADYVSEKNVIQGRSWGCPAVAPGNRDKVISMLKNGSIIYAGISGS
jgi:hypothetical protein